MAVTMPFMVALGLGGVRFWVLVTQVPKSLVATLVGAMCLLGSYAAMNDVFAIYITVFFGVIGYGLNKINIHPAPIVLALVLGYLTESNLRRAMLSSDGDWTTFFTHPISLICLIAAFITLVLPILRSTKATSPA